MVFDGDWSNQSEMLSDFGVDKFDGIVIYAGYEYADYSGDAAVIYADGGKLWMTSGSHCSCYGLEGQWSPDEVTVEMLQRIAHCGYGYDQKAAQYCLKKAEEFGGLVDADAFACALQLVG